MIMPLMLPELFSITDHYDRAEMVLGLVNFRCVAAWAFHAGYYQEGLPPAD